MLGGGGMGSNQELRLSSKTWKVSLDYAIFIFFSFLYIYIFVIVRGITNENEYFIFIFFNRDEFNNFNYCVWMYLGM